MLLAELTFTEELIKAAVGPVLTGVFVTVGGGVAVHQIGKRREDRRQRFELRTGLLERTSRVAATMFMACQHVARLMESGTRQELKVALTDLEKTYQNFAVEARVLQYEIGARFGFTEGDHPDPSGRPSRVFERWHQIADLLTTYRFNLAGTFPNAMLERYSIGYEQRHHTGLDLESFGDDLDSMRDAIREAHREARRDLAHQLLIEDLVTG